MSHRPDAPSTLDPELQRRTAADLFNHTWALIEKVDRTPRETDLMIHAAHASRFLWESIGNPENHARGEWLVSRVYAVAERPEPARHHAQRCLEICQEHALGDFDLSYAYEAMARSLGLAGDREAAGRFARLAADAGSRIADPDDRELLEGDLATL